MATDDLFSIIAQIFERIEDIRTRSLSDPAHVDMVLSNAIEALKVSLKELSLAAEELRQQNKELIEAADEHEKSLMEIEESYEASKKNEEHVRQKLESILSPASDIGNLELADIIDAQALQALMDGFYELAHIPMSIDDLKGSVLVGVGWQDICTKFHRANPETCRHCMESDTELSKGIPQGEFRLYRCKNNMWDIATPIVIGGQHVGNLFVGQFFFEDEPLDYELFRSQARRYGFDEDEYIAALERVPRLKKESVDIALQFFQKLAHLISQLSYSNIKLARSLAKSDALMAALNESQKNLNRAQAMGHIGSWQLDALHSVMLWSDEAHRILGIPKGTPLTYETFLSAVHPDDRERVNQKWAAATRGEPNEIEHRIVVGEAVKWVREKAELEFDHEGHLLGGFGTTQDITEQKRAEEALRQSEQLYRLLFETMLQGVVYQDADGKIISMNPAAERILGKTPEEFLGSSSVGEERYTMREDKTPFPGMDHPAMASLRTGQIVRDVVMGVYNPREQSVRWININAVPLFRPGEDSPYQVYTLFDDITERKLMEEELLKARDELEKRVQERTAELRNAKESLEVANEKLLAEIEDRKKTEADLLVAKDLALDAVRAKAAFLANISHELRTPLNTVIGFSSLLLDENLTPDQREYVENIRIGGDSLLALISDILEFTRMEKEAVLLEHQPLSLQDLIRESVGFVAAQAAKKGLKISYTISHDTPYAIVGDRGRLRQILINLLSNAVKFTDAGEVSVSVSSEFLGQNRHQIIFTVLDTGIGIPQDSLDKLFQPLSQIETTISQKRDGAGLGLAISKNLVELMGGKIWAESKPGLGSKFSFTILAEMA